MPYLADNSYLMIKPEATPGTAVIPTVVVPLVSENIKTIVNHVPDRRMKGIDWKANDLLRGNRTHEGDVVVLADPDTLGHFLNMVMLKGSTTGDADGYTHPFTVGASDSYTFEIKKGYYVQRYFGVKINELKIEFVDGQMQLTAKVMAMGQFSIGTLGVALSGSVTALVMDDTYDIAPNRGLVANDVIVVGSTEITVTSVNSNGIGVGFSSTSVTASIGDNIYLKPQTVTQPTLQDPLYFGNLLVGIGADESAATTAAGSRSTATAIYEMAITIKNNLFAQNGTSRIDPVQLLTGTKECMIECKQLFSTVAQRQAWMDREKQAITINAFGKFIKADFSTQELLTLKFNNVKLIENGHEIKVGEYIMDNQQFEVLYDNTDGVAMTASLVNRTAGGSY